jgi:hypothetical protein
MEERESVHSSERESQFLNKQSITIVEPVFFKPELCIKNRNESKEANLPFR